MERVLVMDRGNSRLKLGYFLNGSLQEVQVFENLLIAENYISNLKVDVVCGADVQGQEIPSFLKKYFPINFRENLPIAVDYSSISTLGQDRIANAVALAFEYPNKNALAIDAGTCITYDMLTKGKFFVGGAISPGLEMRLKAMHHFTGKLPKLAWEKPSEDFPYKSSSTNMLGASYDGIIAEIEYYLNEIQIQYPGTLAVITGGDANTLQKGLKSDIFADPNLTLKGIFNIFKYQYAQL